MLRELGLKRDVEYLMELCGVAAMMSQACNAFKDETWQFPSSLVLHFYEDAELQLIQVLDLVISLSPCRVKSIHSQ